MSERTELPANVSVVVSRDTESSYPLAAQMLLDAASDAIVTRGKFLIALSGGSTPKKLFELLASPAWVTKFPWTKTEFFWGDERCVPPTDAASNFHMTQQAMLSRVPVPAANIHRMMTEENDANRVAELYEQEIRRVVPCDPDGWPQFDIMLQGLGTNGHTASLFPYQPTLHEKNKVVVAEYIDEVKMTRLTMTVPAINAGRRIVFFALSGEKATVIREVLLGPFDPERLPAQLIRPTHGQLTWLIDPPAAEKLPAEILQNQ
jgi:6-phosphogluconolactonase